MRAPLRVLFVSSDASSASGVGRCICDLITHLDREIIEPILATDWPSTGEQTIISEARSAGITVVHRELGRWFPPNQTWGVKHLYRFFRSFRTRIWALSHLIEKHKVDVVYTNALPSPDGALVARQCGRPHIWHLHEAVCGNQYLRPYLPCFATKWLIRKLSTRVVLVSHQKAAEFAGNPLPAEVRVVHNGVDLARFSVVPQDPAPLLGSLGLPEGTRLVILVGIVSAHKGHGTLVRAAARILEELPDVAFLFAGSELSNFGDELRRMIKELGISSRVFFLGPRDDIPDLLSRVDLLVLPSTQEALPLVVMEAMASGKPVVATRCGGPEEIVVDGETGYLVPVGDDQTLADRIVDVLKNPELAREMGKAGRNRVEAEFSVAAYAQNIQNIILEAHASHSSKS